MMKTTLLLIAALLLLAACKPAMTPTEKPGVTTPTATPLPPTPTPTPTPKPTPWKPVLPKEPCVPSENRSCEVLFVLPPKYYAENARMFPDQFRNAGYTVKMASSYSSVIEVRTSSFDDSISELAYQVDLIFKEVNVSDYDATIYIGGYGCQDQWTDKASLRIAQAAIEQGKVLGATGCGATILAYAGLLQGKQAVVCSGNPPVKNGKDYCKILESLGAICSQEVIVREGLIVTAKQRSPDFVAAIIEVINESH